MKKILATTLFCLSISVYAQGIVTINFAKKFQTIDGFGAFQGGTFTTQTWWQNLYINDLECSIYRIDLTPRVKAPYSDLSYFSPWFMGSQTKSVFNFEDPANPNGPEGNRVRTYTGPSDYSRSFGGRNAPIAVMGPNIETNINYFTYPLDSAISGLLKKKKELGDVKFYGSIWSPLPWLKVSSGNTYNQNWWPGPVAGSKWPFVWGGNFAGGRLDVSGTKYQQFNDSNIGGTGNTDALTQFARSSAAYILGYQRYYNFKFYAISIQNELNFEEYYSSMTYPLSSQYIAALKAIRNEFNKYPELKDIRIAGPEDLLGGDSYGMWEYGGPTHKNLQYLAYIAKDPEALKALDFVCIHGYANDGVSSAGANPTLWNWWVNGWTTSPAAGIPANVQGYSALNKKSWMTETSGENREWLFPKNAYPNNGAWSVALKIHQALTTGNQSAWLYWTFAESNSDGTVSDYALTNETVGTSSPKYVAAKHFYKYIRPGSYRMNTLITSNSSIQASSYYNDSTSEIIVVLINTAATTNNFSLSVEDSNPKTILDVNTSFENSYFIPSILELNNGSALISMPAYSIKTIHGKLQKITSIQSVQKLDNEMYYNSTDKLFYCYFPNSEGNAIHYSILNMNAQELSSGEIIPQGKDFKSTIPSPELVSGIYFIQLNTNTSSSCKKIILTK
ncbi:MAG: hypothetical protein ABI851_08695 [Saprospiraceae bacterium]